MVATTSARPVSATDSPAREDVPLQLQRLASLSIDELKGLDDIAVIRHALAAVTEEETKLDQELNAFLGSEQLGQDRLLEIRPQLTHLLELAVPLSETVKAVGLQSDTVCDRIKELDKEQKRIQSAIQRINDIQDLKRCVVGIQSAIQQQDYETAAGYIHRYLHFDPTTLRSALDDISYPSALDQDTAALSTSQSYTALAADSSFSNSAAARAAQVLDDGRRQLKEIVMKSFAEATEASEERAIARFFKLFPLIGEAEMGLTKYANYVCAILSRKCQDALHSTEQAKNPVSVDMLTRLYDNIAILIDQHAALVETHYGPGQLIRIIQRFHREAETQSCVILDMWAESRQFKRIMSEVKTGLSHNATNIQPRDLDGPLSEIAMFSNRAQIYCNYMHARAKTEMDILTADKSANVEILKLLDSNKALSEDGLPRQSALEEQIQQLLVSYIGAEELFLQMSIAKAIEIDEIDKVSMVASCVDDTFYVLKKCLMRSISTSDIGTCCAVVQTLAQIMESDYLNAFKTRFSSYTTLTSSNTNSDDVRVRYMVQLNSLDVSSLYLPRLVRETETAAVASFHLQMPEEEEEEYDETSSITKSMTREHEKLSSCLVSFLDLDKQIKRELKIYTDALFTQLMKQKCLTMARELFRDIVQSPITSSMQSRYQLTEEEYATLETNHIVIARNPGFVKSIEAMMQQSKISLTPNVYASVMLNVVETILKEWEKILLQSRFNQLGALQLDKDIRSIANLFSAHQQAVSAESQRAGHQSSVGWPTLQRDKFTRLNQISLLLNFESVDELYDYWGSRAITAVSWRFTLADVKKILGLR